MLNEGLVLMNCLPVRECLMAWMIALKARKISRPSGYAIKMHIRIMVRAKNIFRVVFMFWLG